MSPSLFDVATILGLPTVGDELPSLYDEIIKDLGFKVTKQIALPCFHQ